MGILLLFIVEDKCEKVSVLCVKTNGAHSPRTWWRPGYPTLSLSRIVHMSRTWASQLQGKIFYSITSRKLARVFQFSFRMS
jgi:hypothetical protein